MNKITKNALALILASNMIVSFAGCNSKEIKQGEQNSISTSASDLKTYNNEELMDCWVVKYNDARGDKSILFVEILPDLSGNFVYPIKNYSEYLYHSETDTKESVINEYFENCNLGTITSQEKLIGYLANDYGVKIEYTEEEINKSINKLETELEVEKEKDLITKKYVDQSLASKIKTKEKA